MEAIVVKYRIKPTKELEVAVVPERKQEVSVVKYRIKPTNERELAVLPERKPVAGGTTITEMVRRGSRMGERGRCIKSSERDRSRHLETDWGTLNEVTLVIEGKKSTVLKISGGKEGFNWEALPHKLELAKGWVDKWSTLHGTISYWWDHR